MRTAPKSLPRYATKKVFAFQNRFADVIGSSGSQCNFSRASVEMPTLKHQHRAIGALVSLQLALDEKVKLNKLTEERNAYIRMKLSQYGQHKSYVKERSRKRRIPKSVSFSTYVEYID